MTERQDAELVRPWPECVDCIDCAVCSRELPPRHRHHHVWEDGNQRRGVC